MDVRAALKGQYHAALAMLKTAIDACPDGLWTDDERGVPFWQVAYHVIFYTHLYLAADEASFEPWEHHREEYQFLEALPWPPHRPPKIGEPYTKDEVLAYWRFVDQRVDAAVDGLDLDVPACGFWWYDVPKLDHQINNLRHVQHHAALLAGRLRAADGTAVPWVG